MRHWLVILMCLLLPSARVLSQDTLKVMGTVVNDAVNSDLPLQSALA